MAAEKDKSNLKVLVPILVNGEHQAEGTVIPKSAIAKGEWQNLVFAFDPPRLEETDEAVGKPKAAKAAMPGA